MSFFKRPAWAKLPEQETGEGTQPSPERDLFSHSDQFQSIVADTKQREKEREQRRKDKEQRKEGKRKAKLERRSSSKRTADDDDDEDIKPTKSPESPKRRRISKADTDALLRIAGLSNVVELDSDTDEEAVRLEEQEHGNDQPAAEVLSRPASRRADDAPESGGEDQGDDVQIVGSNAVGNHVVTDLQEDDEDQEDEDPFFAELRRNAREQNRVKKLHEPSETPELDGWANGMLSTTSPELTDGIVQLFITSRIPDTKPLLVKRCLSQSLRDVFDAWLGKQLIPPGLKQEAYFTFRLRRILPSTLVRTLGLSAEYDGTIYLDGPNGREATDKIHLEVVTDEILAQLKAEKERRARVAMGHASDDDEGADQPHAAKEPVLRLTLRAKGEEDVKIKASPSTQISRIAQYYRQKLNAAEHWTVRLEFDGEPLDEGDYVRDTELEDMFTIDVHVSR